LMAPKSIVYMVVAVFVGYILVSAVPGQMAMYTTPTLTGEKGDTITLTGKGFSPENESLSVEENDSVELFWDTVNSTEGSHGLWVNNESILLDIEDLSAEIEKLSEIEVGSDNISSVAEASADVEAAADSASALKSARLGFEFMGTMVWLTVDVLVAMVVYWFAKRRFA